MKGSRLALYTVMLSITIAEFTTGATALTAIFTNPAGFFLFSIPSLFGLYGCGVLLVREAGVRWKKGWPTILLLGIVYGIMEEGIAVHTFFSPVTNTVGIFGEYGKFFSLDATWAILISLFHSVFSIALPILIGNLLWPETEKEQILKGKSLHIVFILYLLTVTILFIVVPYKPDLAWTFILLAVSSVLIYGSSKSGLRIFRKDNTYSGFSTKIYFLAGLFYFPFIIIFPRFVTFLPYLITNAILIAGAIIVYRILEIRLPGNDRRKLAVMVVGMIWPVQLFGVLLNISTNPLQIIAVLALIYVELKVLKATRGMEFHPEGKKAE